ncbi:MAG: UDP-N-acetylglucosamine 2-epimerase (non-hydrolyzing) [Candidatus Aminicenantes bacterium]|nr:UDP-N-acetylglucosamine 2-epimerase (non-hydrolyzing) [Candidatus Aminicenantes bacterium]MDH5744306.1 UDP-N-acetylglucosamine 2-epimerase (non-hydrolyzing) [Candidatus Aminicenantes bacterium]
MNILSVKAIKVMPIVGVRPQIIKSAPVLHLLDEDEEVTLQLIHSGQHYDFEMSKVFFNEFDLPDPLRNLGIGRGSHATQTARLMMRTEKIIRELKPDVIMVFGDANTTLGGALAAVKVHVPVCHVEAGLRDYDLSVPEEVNRVLTDHCSQMLCAPTLEAFKNLRKEGIKESNILLSGDTMYDALLQHKIDIEKSAIVKELGLTGEIYAVLTLHRAENVDDRERLTKIISAIVNLAEVKTVFPVHPRTKKRLRNTKLEKVLKRTTNVILTEPLGYFDMLSLMENSAVVLTDSGGMQKEAFLLHVPCVTLRHVTGWVETVELGANKLVGAESEQILRETRKILEDEGIKRELKSLPNPFGDGRASQKIVKSLKGIAF